MNADERRCYVDDPAQISAGSVLTRINCIDTQTVRGMKTICVHLHSSAAPKNLAVRRSRAFTLIEVMIVVVILGILAAVVIPRILDRPDQAKVTAAKADIAIIMQALKLYRLDNGFYPSTDQGLQALIQKPTSTPQPASWKQGGYIERLPTDPWKTPYQFLNPGLKGEIDVFSYGADKQSGGEGNNADIGSWNL